MPTVGSIRAFSSRSNSQKEAVVKWNSPFRLSKPFREDNVAPEQIPLRYMVPKPTAAEMREKEQKLLRAVWAHGIAECPLPVKYETIRQKYKMTGPEYDYYWRLAAGGQMLGKTKPSHMGTKAQRKLREIQDAKQVQGGDHSGPEGVTVTHKILMSEARELSKNLVTVLSDLRGEARSQDATTTKTNPAETIEDAFSVIDKTYGSRASNVGSTSNLDPGAATKDVDKLQKKNKKKKEAAKKALSVARRAAKKEQASAREDPATHKCVWTQLEVAKNATDEFETRTIGAAVVELKEEVVDKLKTHTTGADVVEMEEEVLEEPETQKTKANGVEAEKIALRKSAVKAPQGTDMEAQRENARMVNVHENMAQQEGKTSARIETERLEKLRKAKLVLLSKKEELLEQLQAANEIPWPTIAAEKMEDKLKSFELDNVLYSAHQKLNPKTRGPKLAGSPGDTVYRPPITPAPGSSLDTTDAKISLSTETPTLQKSTQSLYSKTMQEAEHGFHISSIRSGLPAPSKKPIEDDIRIEVSSSGEIGIDSDLTLQLNADLSHLKSQVSQMQDRLKASFPRIDTLPYDVSETENKKTLQTWLKILAGRWRARYNNAESQENLSVVDAQVRSVMDQMVRDHDLSNAAAKRMAEKWVEVSTRRGVMTGDAGGVIDLDELDAGGMSFLNDQDAGEKVDGEQWELEPLPATQSTEFSGPHVPETPLPEHSAAIDDGDAVKQDGLDATGMGFSRNDDINTVSQSNKATASRSSYTSSLQPLSRRAYSTTSRPPPDSPPNPPSPSLPHLTSSGSAHMVSVSAKPHTVRTAIAVGTVYFSNAIPLGLIKSNSLKKGDVLSVSRIAGIMAAKKCPDLIPLCHPIALTHVGVELQVFDAKAEAKDDMGFGGVSIEAKVTCTGPTGVEMEALTSVMGCALSVVDMCKAVDKFQRVGDVRVVLKEGGKSGVWREEGWRSFQGQGTG